MVMFCIFYSTHKALRAGHLLLLGGLAQ